MVAGGKPLAGIADRPNEDETNVQRPTFNVQRRTPRFWSPVISTVRFDANGIVIPPRGFVSVHH